jgi:hypothetical protein
MPRLSANGLVIGLTSTPIHPQMGTPSPGCCAASRTWFVLSPLPGGLPNGHVVCRVTGFLCSLDKTASLSNAPG